VHISTSESLMLQFASAYWSTGGHWTSWAVPVQPCCVWVMAGELGWTPPAFVFTAEPFLLAGVHLCQLTTDLPKALGLVS